MKEHTELYVNCMEELRDRVNLISAIGQRRITTGVPVFDAEFAFVQFRKILELIAFASLTANKEKYSAAHAKFATHWKANLMLEELEKINPDFYPVPVGAPQEQPGGVKHFPVITDGFLTKEDFAFLYDKTGEVLHVGNPFGDRSATLDIKYSPQQWVSRIQLLLATHMIQLVDDKKWIVQIPESGSVRLWTAEPVQAASQ